MLYFSSFVTRPWISRMIKHKKVRNDAVRILRDTGVQKLYLETYWDRLLSEDEMRYIKDFFESKGFKASAAVGNAQIYRPGPQHFSSGESDIEDEIIKGEKVFGERAHVLYLTTWEGIFQEDRKRIELNESDVNVNASDNSCLTSQITRAGLDEIMTATAKVFDEIITEDLMHNICFCPRCLSLFREKYGFNGTVKDLALAIVSNDYKVIKDWGAHSGEIVMEVFRDHIVAPAKKVNPDVNMILKTSEFYHDYPLKGMYLDQLIPLFDSFMIGAENRENKTRYGSFITPRIAKNLAGEKFKGVWVDFLSSYYWWRLVTTPRICLEQLRESILGESQEVCLFSLEQHMNPKSERTYKKIIKDRPILDMINENVTGVDPTGIDILLPRSYPHVTFHQEGYIIDILGSIGIPLNIVSHRENVGKNVIITAHTARKLDPKWLEDRENVVLTSGALCQLVKENNTPVLKMAGLDLKCPIPKDVIFAGGLSFNKGMFPWPISPSTGAIPLGPALKPSTADTILMSFGEKGDYPIVSRNKYNDVTVYCVALTWAPWHLKWGYPESIRDLFRDIIGEITGLKINAIGEGLRSITLHSYSNGCVFINSLDESYLLIEIALNTDKMKINSETKIRNIESGSIINSRIEDGWVKISYELAPSQILGLKIEK